MKKTKYPILDMLKNKETMSPGTFWSECGILVITYFTVVLVLAMVLSATLTVSIDLVTRMVEYIALGMIPLWCIPLARNSRLRLRDAGYTAKAYLWLLLPVVGWLIFVILLCRRSAPRKPDGTMLK